jgi:hypothetical protein
MEDYFKWNRISNIITLVLGICAIITFGLYVYINLTTTERLNNEYRTMQLDKIKNEEIIGYY